MKNKAVLTLIEQIFMGLVFAFAMAVCLRVFVFSDNLSVNIKKRDQMVLAAQNAAETMKNTHGDIQKSLEAANVNGALKVDIEPVNTASPYLKQAVISVSTAGLEPFQLTVSWQQGVTGE